MMTEENFIGRLSSLSERNIDFPFLIENIYKDYCADITEEVISEIIDNEDYNKDIRFAAFYVLLYKYGNRRKILNYCDFFNKYKDKFNEFVYLLIFEGNCLRFTDEANPDSLRKSIELFKEALQKLPDHAGIKRNIASTILKYCKCTEYDDQMMKEAIVLTQEAIAYKPFSRYYATLAELQEYSGNFNYAMQNINNSIDICTNEEERAEYLTIKSRIAQRLSSSIISLKHKVERLDLNDANFTVKVRNAVINYDINEIDKLYPHLENELLDECNRFKIYYAILTYYRRKVKNDNYKKLVLDYGVKFSDTFQNHPLMLVSQSIKAKFEGDYITAISFAEKAADAERVSIIYDGVNQNYADIVASALELGVSNVSFSKRDIEKAIDKLRREMIKGQGYAKYYCTQGRLLYLSDPTQYEEACQLIERAINLEDSTKSDYSIRISQYYHSMINIKLQENSRSLLSKFNEQIQTATNTTLSVLDNQKSKYFEILAFFASMVALIISTVNVAVKFTSSKESSSILLVLAGVLTFSYGMFRLLMSYNQEKNHSVRTFIVLFISAIVIAFGIWLGATKCF